MRAVNTVCRQIDKKTHRSKDALPELGEVLRDLKRSEFNDSYLSRYKVVQRIVGLLFKNNNTKQYNTNTL